MTKHLRLIMLSLLAMICLGGYSQSETVFKTLSFPDENKENNIVQNYTTTWEAKIGNDTWSIANCNNNKWLNDWAHIAMGSSKKPTVASIATDTELAAAITKVVVNYGTVVNLPKNLKSFKLIVASDKQFNEIIETIVGDNSFTTSTSSTFQITIPAERRYFKLEYDLNKTVNEKGKAKNGIIQIKSIEYYSKPASSKTPTTTTFGADYDGKTFNFANGVREGWKAPTATHTPADVAGTTAYKSDNEAVAKVGANGQLTFTGYGEATITATFTPDETKTYAASSASYTVINKDPYVVDVVFVASVDKGNTTVTGKDEMSKNGVSIQSENAALGNGENYRFYQNITAGHTFSVKRGFITKIVFEGGTSDYSLKNVKLKDQNNGVFAKTVTKATWNGEAKSVVFTTSGQARATKITVTVKLPVAKDYTLDEEDINVIEDYDNANVTLTRTFYHDNAWNTLCLPFDVDANKVATAFAGAEIREIDPNKCTANTIQFVPATEIKAGVPYIIKWNENVAEAKPFEETFEGVMLVAEPKPVTINNNDIKFTGFYNKTTADNLGESVAAIGAENKLFKVTSGEMKGFRAAFVLNSNAQPSAIKLVIDGTATGIEDLVIDGVKANGRVYNLNGQYVGNSLNGLQPGLYIQNGKKIVVK